jgi:propionate CoA-transferase
MSERKIIARRAAHGAAGQRGGEPRHRHAGGGRRVAAEEQVIDLMTLTAEPGVIGGIPRRAQLRRGDQHPGDHRPAQPVRFLRRRRARHRLPRAGPGRPRGQPQRLQVRPAAGRAPAASSTSRRTPRRSSSSAPSPPAGWRWRSTTASLRIVCETARRRNSSRRSSTAPSAARRRQVAADVLYVTERCVFRLCADGLELIEIAPGIDLQKDILERMDFTPHHALAPTLMDARIFRTSR